MRLLLRWMARYYRWRGKRLPGWYWRKRFERVREEQRAWEHWKHGGGM